MLVKTLWIVTLHLTSCCFALSVRAWIHIPNERDVDFNWQRDPSDPESFTFIAVGPAEGVYNFDGVSSQISSGNMAVVKRIKGGEESGESYENLSQEPGYYCICAVEGRFKGGDRSNPSILWFSQNLRVDSQGVLREGGNTPPPPKPPTPPSPPQGSSRPPPSGTTIGGTESESESISTAKPSSTSRPSTSKNGLHNGVTFHGSEEGASETSVHVSGELTSTSTSTFEQPPTDTPVNTLSTSESRPPIPAIVGAVIGIILFLLFILLLVVFLKRRSKRREGGYGQSASPFDPTSTSESLGHLPSTTPSPHESRVDMEMVRPMSVFEPPTAHHFHHVDVEPGELFSEDLQPVIHSSQPPDTPQPFSELERPFSEEPRPQSDAEMPESRPISGTSTNWSMFLPSYYLANQGTDRLLDSASNGPIPPLPPLPNYISKNPYNAFPQGPDRDRRDGDGDGRSFVTTPGLPPYPYDEHYSMRRKDTPTPPPSPPPVPRVHFATPIMP